MEYKIYCTPPSGDRSLSFAIYINPNCDVFELKEAIKHKIPNQVDDCDVNLLRLFLQVGENEEEPTIPKRKLSKVFGDNGPPVLGENDPDHIIVRLPEM
jgi:hypothetical protein